MKAERSRSKKIHLSARKSKDLVSGECLQAKAAKVGGKKVAPSGFVSHIFCTPQTVLVCNRVESPSMR